MMIQESSAGSSAGDSEDPNGTTHHQPAMRRSQSSSLCDRIRVNPREKQRLTDPKIQHEPQAQERQEGSAMDSMLQLHIARHKEMLQERQGSIGSKPMDLEPRPREQQQGPAMGGPQKGPGMDSQLHLKIARHKLQHDLRLLEQQQGPDVEPNTQLKIAHQKIALLTKELKRCQVEKEAVRASFLTHVEASRKKLKDGEEAIEKLRLENEALRLLLGPGKAADLHDSAVSTISELTVDENLLHSIPGPPRSNQAVKCNERMGTSSLHSIPEPSRGRGDKLFNPFACDLVVNDEDSVESVEGQGVSERAALDLTTNWSESKEAKNGFAIKTIKMPSRCQSEGLLVGFGGKETRSNSAANMLSKMRVNHQNRSPSADESGGLPVNSAQNSTWGLIRPNKPSSAGQTPGDASSSQNSFWGLIKSSKLSFTGKNLRDASPNTRGLPPNSSQTKNASWGLINQGASRDKNRSTKAPQDQPTNSTLDSTHFATSETFEQDIKFGDASGMDPVQDVDFKAIMNCSIVRDFLESADIGDDGPENSDKPFVKAPISRCQSEGIGFGGLARRLSSPNKPNFSGDAPINSEETAGETEQNATWGLIRPNRRAATSGDVPRDLPRPPKNAAWDTMRPSEIDDSVTNLSGRAVGRRAAWTISSSRKKAEPEDDAEASDFFPMSNAKDSSFARCNSDAPRLSHVSEESNTSVPTRCSSEGLLVGFGGMEVRTNSAAKLLMMRSKNQSSAGKISEDVPADSSQNSTWGLIRPNQTSPANDRSGGPIASSSHNSSWCLIKPSKNETLDSIQAKLLQSKLNPVSTPEEGIKLGTAGDDWSANDEDADKDAEEERIRRVVSERSLRRQKADAMPRKGSENALDKGHARSKSVSGQSEARRAECMKKWSSLIGLDQHQHHLAKKTQAGPPVISSKPTATQNGIPSMMRVNSLASIPEKPRATFSHRQGRRRGEQQH